MNADDLNALARKYQTLTALRTRRDGGGSAPDRAVFMLQLRALAREFPGCLRELDTLGATELARRAAITGAAATGGDAASEEPWMPWINSYHALMRAALEVRRRRGMARDDGAALAAEASRIAGVALDITFVDDVTAPPQGRIGIVVLRRLGALYQQAPHVIAAALFPLRRPSPYTL